MIIDHNHLPQFQETSFYSTSTNWIRIAYNKIVLLRIFQWNIKYNKYFKGPYAPHSWFHFFLTLLLASQMTMVRSPVTSHNFQQYSSAHLQPKERSNHPGWVETHVRVCRAFQNHIIWDRWKQREKLDLGAFGPELGEWGLKNSVHWPYNTASTAYGINYVESWTLADVRHPCLLSFPVKITTWNGNS